jgi:hypothetical protein
MNRYEVIIKCPLGYHEETYQLVVKALSESAFVGDFEVYKLMQLTRGDER